MRSAGEVFVQVLSRCESMHGIDTCRKSFVHSNSGDICRLQQTVLSQSNIRKMEGSFLDYWTKGHVDSITGLFSFSSFFAAPPPFPLQVTDVSIQGYKLSTPGVNAKHHLRIYLSCLLVRSSEATELKPGHKKNITPGNTAVIAFLKELAPRMGNREPANQLVVLILGGPATPQLNKPHVNKGESFDDDISEDKHRPHKVPKPKPKLVKCSASTNQDSQTSYSILLQNAETVALISSPGGRHQHTAIPVTSLKLGDEILLRVQGGARHTGIEIQEFIVEK
ncbi:3-dehydroquinate synthase [Sesamum angolense]|uniref:3-dehydroquinate synthase n=1 Tax=Sesamum angolense TaxID=2727404 RepID=A0AAE1WH18_9LAMI|nr:3-dehydroquinate synthase [Sesamum angolense]